MTYCVGVLLDKGMIFASDSRTNAGLDNVQKFCKMTVFERKGDRVLVLLSSGNLAGTQAVISILKQRGEEDDETAHGETVPAASAACLASAGPGISLCSFSEAARS